MSSKENKTSYNSREGELENAQDSQEKVGDAAKDPETAGPAGNLREKAARSNSQDSSRDPT
ncbi:MAG: hypothetical protein ACREAO_04460 [Nitrososphaera sp.]